MAIHNWPLSGEGGIQKPVSAQRVGINRVAAQRVVLTALAVFLLIMVICGRLGLLGNSFSTLSAHLQQPALPSRGRQVAASSARSRRSDSRCGPGVSSNIAASYARYSSALQDASSIDQQRRKCRERAEQDGNTILSEFEFGDEAISGTKRERDGLNAMLEAAKSGRFGTLYLESLSRLARESVITMPILKDLVANHQVRVVVCSEGIDSAQENWELVANSMAWVSELYVKNLRAAVLRGQEEAVLNDRSVGDWCFGYTSEPVPGTVVKRRGRDTKPQRRVVIHEAHAQWVRQVFEWFVDDRRSLSWIKRELNRCGAPKDHRATTKQWHHQSVRLVLRNTKYVGCWRWGAMTNTRNPLTGQISQKPRSIEETNQFVRDRPELRIIDDRRFADAQALLDEAESTWGQYRRDRGRLSGSRRAMSPPRHLLQGLIRCGTPTNDGTGVCGGTFQVNGGNGRYLGCARYRSGMCTCRTRLPRRAAERKILEVISQRILEQPSWVDAVHAASVEAWRTTVRQTPSQRDSLTKELASIDAQTKRLLDFIENQSGPIDEVASRLAQRRSEKRQIELQLARLPERNASSEEPPIREWVAEQLFHLKSVIDKGGELANKHLRRMTGGAITVTEELRSGRKRKHLVGRFTISAESALEVRDLKSIESADGIARSQQEEIVISFCDESPWATIAEQVKKLFDAGMKFREIAAALKVPRGWVARALLHWHRQRGLNAPDGRKVRKRLQQVRQSERLASRAKALWDQHLSMQDIAAELGCGRDMVTAAIRSWFESQGLPAPDGRHRRRELNDSRRAISSDTKSVI